MFCKQPTELESSKKENGFQRSDVCIVLGYRYEFHRLSVLPFGRFDPFENASICTSLCHRATSRKVCRKAFNSSSSSWTTIHLSSSSMLHAISCALGIAGEIADVQSFDDWNRSSQSFYGQIFTSPCSILTLDGDRSIHGLQKRFRWPGRQICALFFLYFCVGRFFKSDLSANLC